MKWIHTYHPDTNYVEIEMLSENHQSGHIFLFDDNWGDPLIAADSLSEQVKAALELGLELMEGGTRIAVVVLNNDQSLPIETIVTYLQSVLLVHFILAEDIGLAIADSLKQIGFQTYQSDQGTSYLYTAIELADESCRFL